VTVKHQQLLFIFLRKNYVASKYF